MENISVTEPINLALGRVRGILFAPIDLGKWFTIGFCAWLAGLGERGFRGSSSSSSSSDNNGGDIHQQLEHAGDFIRDNLYWILPVAIAAVTIIIALWLLFLWLNCRGKFMFLYCVALDRAEVKEPWDRFASAANSLFWFRFVLGLIGMVIMLPLVVLIILLTLPMLLHGAWNFAGIMAIIGFAMGMVLVGLFFLVIRKLTADFVVPIMFLRQNRCLAAWREFGQLLRTYTGDFVLYLLFQIVIAMVIGVMVLFVIVVTCCIAGCLLIIPYVGTVLLLPFSVFRRSYSLYYLAQFGPAYNVFPATPPAY